MMMNIMRMSVLSNFQGAGWEDGHGENHVGRHTGGGDHGEEEH